MKMRYGKLVLEVSVHTIVVLVLLSGIDTVDWSTLLTKII